MKILHITPWPGPPFSGANVNLYNFLKRLTPKHRSRFIIVCSTEAEEQVSGQKLAGLGIRNEEIDIVRHSALTQYGLLPVLIASRLPPIPAFLEREVAAYLRKAILRAISEWQPDVLLVWWWPLASIVAGTQGIPKVLYACDSPSLANFSAGLHAENILRKMYYRAMCSRASRFERLFFSSFDQVIFISKRDADHANRTGSIPTVVICNGVDASELAPPNEAFERPDLPVIVFHGDLAYPPNRECVEFLASSVGERMESEFGSNGFQIRVIGAGAGTRLLGLAESNRWLQLIGYVKDLKTALATGTIYVAPVLSGSGVKNKVLDAMACGLPVVGTVEAFSGLDLIPGTHCVTCARERISHEVVSLILDPERRKSLGAAARKWVEEEANWDVQAELLDAVLIRAATRTATASPVSPHQ
jgi:polysaccharide biosynthesis protein PslH